MSDATAKPMDDIMSLCKRRGFVYQASEIYGGINGFWDYGPLGAQLKKNLRDAWWEDMIMNPCWGRTGPGGERVRCVPVETCIIQNPKVWEASGHVGGFNDPMVDCRECKSRFRADQVFGGAAWSSDLLFKKNPALEPFRQQLGEESINALVERDSARVMQLNRDLQPLHDWLNRRDRIDLPIVAVTAGSYDEARALAAETVLKNKQLRGLRVTEVHPLLDWPDEWPPCACPHCGRSGSLTEPRQFNLMFHSYTGAVFNEESKVYLRPETAQGIFVQFKNVVDTTRVRVPFGIGNTGRSFRNEVTPRNFTFRSREFEQAELEFFCHPDDSFEWYKFWRDFRMEWWQSIGLAGENLILREHEKDELSHYSTGTSDVEYRFPFTAPGFGELEGIAHRGNYDLTQHAKHSGAKLEYFDTDRGELLPNGSKKGERYMPHCIEPAAGLDRGALALICEAYTRDESRPSPEIMKFHPRVAPIKAAVFPLVNKDGMPEVADRLHADLFKRFGRTGFIETDAKQSIGKRYARMDEAGCPFCFTIDGDTLTDQTVTVRSRDTGAQHRIAIDKVSAFLTDALLA
jgi:glycyl-tRNA synthetase